MGNAWNYEIDEKELNEFLDDESDDVFFGENSFFLQTEKNQQVPELQLQVNVAEIKSDTETVVKVNTKAEEVVMLNAL